MDRDSAETPPAASHQLSDTENRTNKRKSLASLENIFNKKSLSSTEEIG